MRKSSLIIHNCIIFLQLQFAVDRYLLYLFQRIALQMNSNTTISSTSHHPDKALLDTLNFRIYDTLVGVAFSLCGLVGTPGNIAALGYFRSTGKKDLATQLYTAVCLIDICSSICHIPVTATFFNNRQPGVFDNGIVCMGWYTFHGYLQMISMFLVMLLSLSRTIVIISPFFKVNKSAVISSFVLYSVLLAVFLGWSAVKPSVCFQGNAQCGFNRNEGYCYRVLNSLNGDISRGLNQAMYAILIGFPAVIITASFIVSTAELYRQQQSISNRRNRRASVTMTLFTAAFLVCNFPNFTNTALYAVASSGLVTYPGPIYSNKFMYFYSWVISEVFLTVLNASLNPILYFYRMSGFRTYLRLKFKFNRC